METTLTHNSKTPSFIPTPNYNHIDLFSGIGGFALSARWAGVETVQFVEIDPFCQKVLQKNFKGVPIHDDIKTYSYASIEDDGRYKRREDSRQESKPGSSYESGIIDGENRPPFILTGGFPCQPFSCAGKRRGKEDDRYLWPEMLRVVSEAKPTWIIGENVAGFINMGLDDCISDLENQGYEVQAFVIPACAVNAPHRRDRVWIVAHSFSNTERGAYGRDSGECCVGWNEQDIGKRNEVGSDLTDENCHAPDTKRTGQLRKKEYENDGENSNGGGRYDLANKDTNNWNTPWIEVATRLCRVDARVPNRVDRLKSLGNAIVPQVAYQIMKGILETENSL